jgi:hypothetical protein
VLNERRSRQILQYPHKRREFTQIVGKIKQLFIFFGLNAQGPTALAIQSERLEAASSLDFGSLDQRETPLRRRRKAKRPIEPTARRPIVLGSGVTENRPVPEAKSPLDNVKEKIA